MYNSEIFNTLTDSRNQNHCETKENFKKLQKPIPISSHSYSHCQTLAITNILSVAMDLLTLTFNINGIKQYVTFMTDSFYSSQHF